MPGTHDLPTFDIALTERAAHMQADIVYGGTSAIDVSNADRFSRGLEFLRLARFRQFRLSGNFDVGHVIWLEMPFSVGSVHNGVNAESRTNFAGLRSSRGSSGFHLRSQRLLNGWLTMRKFLRCDAAQFR